MKYLESAEQKIFIKWFKLQYPQYLYNIYAIPNGGQRKAYIAQIKKELGELPGMPDIGIAIPSGGYHGLFIEMKYGKNKASANQLIVHDALMGMGYLVKICYSADEAIQTVKGYFS